MNLSFKGKTILVGGATDGIGWACVKQFCALGANIILLGRNEQKLSQRLEEISNIEGSLFTLSVDFTKPDELEDSLRKFISENNLQIDIVVNNTGGPAGGPLEKASTSELFLECTKQPLSQTQLMASANLPKLIETSRLPRRTLTWSSATPRTLSFHCSRGVSRQQMRRSPILKTVPSDFRYHLPK